LTAASAAVTEATKIMSLFMRVGLDGLEPSTSSLSGKRSNRAELQARLLCPTQPDEGTSAPASYP
jgi:hypothetical protein